MEMWYTYTGDIDKNLVAQAINWIQSQIFPNGTNIQKLTFFISSTGGDADSGIRLYDYLTALPFEVHTVGFGQVYSAAVTVFLAGSERIAIKNCKFLVHEGIYTIGQPAAPMHIHEETIGILKELGKRNVEIISKSIGKTTAEVEEMMKNVKALSAEQAKTVGIVTSIEDKLPLSTQTQPPPVQGTSPQP